MEAASFCGRLYFFLSNKYPPQKIQRTARPGGKRQNLTTNKIYEVKY